MRPSGFSRFLLVAVPAVSVLLAPVAVQAFKEVDPGPAQFAPVTLAAGQSVRVNLVNLAVDDPNIRPGSCQVEVSFLDAAGRAIDNPNILEVRPGQSATVIAPGGRTDGSSHLRAVVRLVDDPNIKGGRDDRKNCIVAPLMEVFSEETGATLFLNPAVLKGFNPQPDPPGQD